MNGGIERNADDHQSLFGVLFVQFLEQRKMLPAWGAIARPEIDDDDFAAMLEDFLLEPVVLDRRHDDLLFLLRLAPRGAEARKDGGRRDDPNRVHERIPPKDDATLRHLTATCGQSPRDP